MASPFLLRPLSRALVFERRLDQLRARTKAFRDGVLISLLTTSERELLGAYLYDQSPANRTADLFAWEKTWFDQALASLPPGTRILAGGVGAGREVVALQSRGFEVVAFEPSADMVADAKRNHGLEIIHAGYSDVVDAMERGVPFGGETLSANCFGAVLLGWGSLSHVLDYAPAAALLQTADTLAGKGPVLASFLTTAIRGHSSDRPRAFGAKVGKSLRRLRGVEALGWTSENDRNLLFDPSVGFLRFWDPEQLAAFLPQRDMELSTESYPHATFHAVRPIVTERSQDTTKEREHGSTT